MSRGSERSESGPQRSEEPPQLLRFATDDLAPEERAAQWRDVMGRTLTGCTPSSLDGGELRVEFTIAAGEQVRLGRTRLERIRNHRDRACLQDGDDDLIFFLMLDGEGVVEHADTRVRLGAGDGVLARFDRTLDTSWPTADLMLIRLSRQTFRCPENDRLVGALQPRTNTLMQLLQSYARAAWQEAVRTGELAPIADRQLAELISALCAAAAGHLPTRGTPAVSMARLAAMREQIARGYSDPNLSMLMVAAAVGLSERAGYLVFEQGRSTFTDELYAARLDRARERLWGNSRARVADVAFAVGFSDVSHFYRLFRRRFGCTPGEMRNAASKEQDRTA